MELISQPYFGHDFGRNKFIGLHSINLPNLVFKLPLLFKMLGNMCIVILCLSGCDVMNFEINLSFLIKPFPSMTEKVRTKI